MGLSHSILRSELVRKWVLQNGLYEKFVELLLKLDYFRTMQYDVMHTSNVQTSRNDACCLLEVHRLSFHEFFMMFLYIFFLNARIKQVERKTTQWASKLKTN